jgi:arginyl-tRNA synthetase
MNLWDELRQWLDGAMGAWAREKGLDALPAYSIEEPPTGIEADVACNIALLLAKPLKKSPRVVAQELQKALEPSMPGIIDGISIAGAGFLNFKWSSKALVRELQSVLDQNQDYGRSDQGQGKKVMVEFVSANPTGPLHVGHGRGAALGDSIALILNHLGYTVSREYYINDAGNQVQMLAESVRARCLELAGKHVELPEQGYHGDYIKDIAKDYIEKHADGVDDLSAILSFSLRRMLKEIEKDLEGFGVRFDSWFSEASVVQKGLVDKHIEALKKNGYIQEYDGAVWFKAPASQIPSPLAGEGKGEGDLQPSPQPSPEKGEGVPDKDRVLRRKDGRWTYFATDIAYHADKFERGFQRLIDVWGADHHGYVPRVKGSLQALGYDPDQLHIVLYQLVSLSRGGVPVSMSKRSGDFITLKEVLEEVGRDACRFFFALRGPNTAMEFDLELAKKHTEENPVYYLQYAHARICSIFKKGDAALTPALSREGRGGSDLNLSLLKEKEERDLIKRLALFPQSLVVCAENDSPHPLANYLLALGRQFHFFYDHHRVLGEDPALTRARLALLEAVRQILRLGLTLLGVSAPESM